MNQQASQGSEQRMTFRLLSYWNRKKGDKHYPSLADINVSEITEIWHWAFVIDVRDPAEPRFHYFGPELTALFGANATGETLQEAFEEPMLSHTIGVYDKVLANKAPVSDSSSFFHDGKELRYRSLIVPLSSDGATIDYLLGTTNFRAYT